MACIGSQGELTESARKMLGALEVPATPEDVVARTDLPLFRVRAGLREMAEAGLVDRKGDLYEPTRLGLSLLSGERQSA